MHLCHYCPRAICHRCVIWPDDTPEDAPFRCPYCYRHDPKTGMEKDPSPYLVSSLVCFLRGKLMLPFLQGIETSSTPLVLIGAATTRRVFASSDPSPLMILSIRLSDLHEFGNPPIATFHDLFHWLPAGNIEYIDIPFDFTNSGQTRYERTMHGLVKNLTSGEYKRFVILERFTLVLWLIVLEGLNDSWYLCLPTVSPRRGGSTAKQATEVLPPSRMCV